MRHIVVRFAKGQKTQVLGGWAFSKPLWSDVDSLAAQVAIYHGDFKGMAESSMLTAAEEDKKKFPLNNWGYEVRSGDNLDELLKP